MHTSPRSQLEGLLHTVECTLSDFGHLVPSGQLAELRAAIADARRLLAEDASEDNETLRATIDRLKEMVSKPPPDPPQAMAARLAKPR